MDKLFDFLAYFSYETHVVIKNILNNILFDGKLIELNVPDEELPKWGVFRFIKAEVDNNVLTIFIVNLE